MEKVTILILLILSLHAFFSTVDCMKFQSFDIQTVQSSEHDVIREHDFPVIASRPVTEITKPMIDVLFAERSFKFISGSKPTAKTNPQPEPPPQRTKPINHIDLPAAVPVVTEKEAEELNIKAIEYALECLEKDEPFYSFYQNKVFETLCFEGTVVQVSTIPNPEKNDYDNCLYACFVEIDSVLSEVAPDLQITSEVILNIPIMKDKSIISDNKLLIGDKIWCSCAEYDAMPQAIQEIQLSDDIQSYEHQSYYPFSIKKISTFTEGGNKNFAKREITILPIKTLPKDEKAAVQRKERIQSEIARIEDEIKKHGGTFDKWREEYKPIVEKYEELSSKDYKVWIDNSYFAAGGKDAVYKTKDYVNGILPYKKYLEENNIDLIIVRIPTKYEFARSVLASDDFQENPAWIEHYYECLKNDIEIVDPMPEMWKHRFDFPLFYFYNDSSELHPFEGQAFISAKVLSDVLKRYPYSISTHSMQLEDFTHRSDQKRFFWPEGNARFNPDENISFKRVVQDGKNIGGLAVYTGSPFLFLSNSYFRFPCAEQGASVPAYAAFFLQHVPDWYYQSGIGNPMLRNLLADYHVLSNRRAVIMVGHPSYWNGSFPPFPKYISDKARTISLEKKYDFLSSDITIIDNASFVFTKKDEEGVTLFTQNTEKDNPNNMFRIELSVPHIEGKKMCMLRFIFGINSYVTLRAMAPGSKIIIDETTISPSSKGTHADLFIPVPDASCRIAIDLKFKYPDRKYSIKNIEVWYY